MDLLPVPPTVIVQLKRVPHSEAVKLLEPYRSKLTDTEYTHYLSLAQPQGPDLPQEEAQQVRVSVTDPLRRRFMAVAWIVGASHRQIADLFGIRRSTVMDQVSMILPKHQRDSAPRLRPTPLPWELLTLLRREWDSDRNSVSGDLVKAAEELLDRALEDYD